MPAYRSSAEAEIREAVVAHIRERRPESRIIHEINVSTHGPNRIDVIAVGRCEIIGVEIKSAKDKLDRLDRQMKSMSMCCSLIFAAIHEKFLVEKKSNDMAAHYFRDGAPYIKTLPDDWQCFSQTWVFPKVRRAIDPSWPHDYLNRWDLPTMALDDPLPERALDMLWRDELFQLCGALRVVATRKSTMDDMRRALRWHCNGKELTQGICRMLRARQCCEADPAIYED